jgi:5'-nucleotidase
MIKKEILYIDMDGVLVDLQEEIRIYFINHPQDIPKYRDCPDHIPGIFRTPPPVEGAVEAIKELALSGKYEMIIATASPWGNPDAATDKRYWIEKYFGTFFKKQMVVSHRKDLLMGDYLIDDRTANGAGEFKGELLSFGWAYEAQKWNEYKTWKQILAKLL